MAGTPPQSPGLTHHTQSGWTGSLTNSPKLRDLVAASGVDRTITFTNAEDEGDITINSFLHILLKAQIPHSALASDDTVIDQFQRLFAFMEFHGCDTARQRTQVWLRWDGNGVSTQNRFVVAAAQNDLASCVAALRASPQKTKVCYGYQIKAQHFTLDPRGMPFSVYKDIPVAYLWALTSAWAEMSAKEMGGYNVECLVEAFRKHYWATQPSLHPAVPQSPSEGSAKRRRA